jgi:hypothetical protein
LDRRYHQDNGDTHAKQDMQSSIVGGYKVWSASAKNADKQQVLARPHNAGGVGNVRRDEEGAWLQSSHLTCLQLTPQSAFIKFTQFDVVPA